ncbi:MAG: type II toxin-antitoxin system HicB family antitoxin [Hyphomonadaceae bacterium]|nr:type II toxin-antitoxin system HicB family antitoxin [Clostridia bacterium]
MYTYPAIFHKEENAYWVEFPDLQGCQTHGTTLSDVLELAQEALGLYLVSLEEDGVTPNEPSNIKAFQTDEDSFTTLVWTDINKYRRNTKAVKKTLTLPQWMNEEAEKRHFNFSSLLQSAILQELEKPSN